MKSKSNHMKRLLFTVLAASALLSFDFVNSRSNAKTAKCLFIVEGKTYINGNCSFEFMGGDGSFSFDDNRMASKCSYYDLGPDFPGQCTMASRIVTRNGTFGQLQITRPGVGTIYWNGGNALHAQGSIEPVYRDGACWSNQKAKLCAW